MFTEKFWSRERFPVVYQNSEAKAVIVDMRTFEKIEIILDNLTNREADSEDSLLIASGLLKELVSEARKISPSEDWRSELDEL